MSTENPNQPPERLTDAEYQPVITACLQGDAAAADRLSRLLAHHARVTVANFQKRESSDQDDLVQETVIAVIGYLRKRGGFDGSLVNFTISVARNRCRNHVIWQKRHATADIDPLQPFLPGRGKSPLDTLADSEVHELLQRALDRLDRKCRRLLRALYIEERSIEEMRREANLTTVQSIYYRRAQCLKILGSLLKKRLAGCSWDTDDGSY